MMMMMMMIIIIIMIIIMMIIIIIIISYNVNNFTQSIHNYIPKTNHVTTIYTVLQLFCIYSLRYM